MSVIPVPAGSDLQKAIDSSVPGDDIQMEAGAVFSGQFTLPKKSGRVLLTGSATLVSSGTSQPALRTAAGAHFWHLRGFNLESIGPSEILTLGASPQTLEEAPTDLILDGLNIEGGPTAKRGITLNSAATIIRSCSITNIKNPGQETQAISGWNGPGPYLIEDCHLEAASIGILIGGAEPSIPNLVPSNIVFRRNTISRPLEWKTQQLACKNHFELKNARYVEAYENNMSYNWHQGQNGFSIVFTVRASGPNSPWSVVEHVKFHGNTIRHSGAGINILGYDSNQVSKQANDIQIYNNLFDDIDKKWRDEGSATGTFLQLVDEPLDISVYHNTVINSGNGIFVDSGPKDARRPIRGFTFLKNILTNGKILGNGASGLIQTRDMYFPNGDFRYNVLAGEPNGPTANYFPTKDQLLKEFMYPGGDYRLKPSSAYEGLGCLSST